MAKRKSRAIARQQMFLISFGVVALGIVGYLTWLTVDSQPTDGFVEGQHYLLVEEPRRIRGEKIEVMEFFSYGCIHCFNFEPMISQWAQERAENINFIQVPATASDYWRLLGRAYYALESLGIREQHQIAFFRAIHDARLVFDTREKIISFFEGRGVDRRKLESAFDSPIVTGKIGKADQLARRMMVAAVPTVVVHGKYLVRTSRDVGTSRMLDVIDYLIYKEVQSRALTDNQSDSAQANSQ